jgi:hypothetical protein
VQRFNAFWELPVFHLFRQNLVFLALWVYFSGNIVFLCSQASIGTQEGFNLEGADTKPKEVLKKSKDYWLRLTWILMLQ